MEELRSMFHKDYTSKDIYNAIGSCKIHYIRDVVLEQIVLEAIGNFAGFVRCYEPVFLYLLARKNSTLQKAEIRTVRKTVESGEQRLKKLNPTLVNTLIQRIEVHSNEKKHKHNRDDRYSCRAGNHGYDEGDGEKSQSIPLRSLTGKRKRCNPHGATPFPTYNASLWE